MAKSNIPDRTYDARPDTLDFRDKMYSANLYEVPSQMELETFKLWNVPVLDQGQEGACTGFGLATVVNYLLLQRKIMPDKDPVSARMLYEMARRYDEWPGEKYSGSSARGAMKGWHKHGICSDGCWPYDTKRKGSLNNVRMTDALRRPLGAYYRVNHKDLVALHAAMAEVGILYATGSVTTGWNNIDKNGIIPFSNTVLGGHAFAIVGYNSTGFWLQNSWGPNWAKGGYALVTYDDWLLHGTDTWVARLGAPVVLNNVTATSVAFSTAAAKSNAYSFADIRPHIISLGNNGELKPSGDFGTSADDVKTIFLDDFPRITEHWKKKRVLLYAHGGLVSPQAAAQRIADYRAPLLQGEVYPISFIWHSDYWSTITNILKDAFQQRKPEGILDAAKDFMLDRLDDFLEPIARALTGKLQWDEMKENALLATTNKIGGARIALQQVAALAKQYGNNLEIHIAGHSAGSIFHALLVQLLTTKGKINTGPLKGATGVGLTIASCTLWAPACTIALFKTTYLPAIKNKSIERFALFALSDDAERDDHCANIYNKSLLYMVSNALEEKRRGPFSKNGTAILGLEKFIIADDELTALFKDKRIKADLVLAPNNKPEGSRDASNASSHGSFDDDQATIKATLARILNIETETNTVRFHRSASSLQNTRRQLQANTNTQTTI